MIHDKSLAQLLLDLFYDHLFKKSVIADTPEGIGPELVVGNNVSLVIQTRNEEETKRLFESLAEGGKIEMPLDAVP